MEALESRVLLHGAVEGAKVDPINSPSEEALVDAAVTTVATARAAGWGTLPNAPQRLFEAMGAAIGGKLYTFAGFYNSKIDVIQSAQLYDTQSRAWSSLQDVPIPESHVGTATDGTTVYFAGGFRNDWFGDADDDFWLYTLATDTWARGPSLPEPRGAAALVLIERTLHFYGGLMADGLTDSADHWALNLDDIMAGWSVRADLPNPRNHFGYTAFDGKAYAIGGQHALDEANGLDADVHVYDPQTDTWAAVAPLPIARSHLHNSTIVDGGRILCVGGTDPGNIATRQILQYDPAADVWSPVGLLPAARSAAIAQSINGRLIVTTGTPTGVLPQVNTWSRAMSTLVATDQADLGVTLATKTPPAVIAGSRGRVVVNVDNFGRERFVGSMTVELRLSGDSLLNDSDELIATREINLRLGADRQRRVPLAFEYPEGIDGDYFLLGRVIPTDPASEATAGNNTAAADTAISIGQPFVDLTGATTPALGRHLTSGGRFRAMVRLQNEGNTKYQGDIGIAIAARPAGIPDASQDVALKALSPRRSIRPAKAIALLTRGSLPETLPVGQYLLVVTLTAATVPPAEIDLINNVLISTEPFAIT